MQAEKIESVGRLAGGIAHDFNNLLTAILGYTELLLGHRDDDDPDRTDLEEIQKAGQRAAALTQQLLAFSRKQVLMPKDVDLNQTVSGLQSMLVAADSRGHHAVVRAGAASPAVVRIDPTQIEQAILNLVLNARDALPAGGEIRLEVSLVRQSQVDAPADLPAGTPAIYVRLRVVDNGVGMSPEARAHLFEPFFTTKEVGKGTGLGLASVYGIVRQSNGFITVESEPGARQHLHDVFSGRDRVGRRRAEPAVGSVPRGRARRDRPAGRGRGRGARASSARCCGASGYHVVEAADARARRARSSRERTDIDLLLTDIVMPEMNGPALAQRLIGLRPELRVLFISGYADMLTPPGGDNPNVGVSQQAVPGVGADRPRGGDAGAARDARTDCERYRGRNRTPHRAVADCVKMARFA